MLRKELSTTAILETFDWWTALAHPKRVSLRSLLVFEDGECDRDAQHKVLSLACLHFSKFRIEISMRLVDVYAHLCADDGLRLIEEYAGFSLRFVNAATAHLLSMHINNNASDIT